MDDVVKSTIECKYPLSCASTVVINFFGLIPTKSDFAKLKLYMAMLEESIVEQPTGHTSVEASFIKTQVELEEKNKRRVRSYYRSTNPNEQPYRKQLEPCHTHPNSPRNPSTNRCMACVSLIAKKANAKSKEAIDKKRIEQGIIINKPNALHPCSLHPDGPTYTNNGICVPCHREKAVKYKMAKKAAREKFQQEHNVTNTEKPNGTSVQLA